MDKFMEKIMDSESVYRFIDDHIVGNTFALIGVSFLIWSFVRFIAIAYILEWLALFIKRKWLNPYGHSLKKTQREKLKESMWFFMYYLTTFIWGVYIFRDEDYLYNTAYYWIDYPNHELKATAKIFYFSQLGFYISALVFLQNNTRVKHKDRHIIAIHHYTTILLISFSSFFQYYRIGTVVFLLHDFSDIFLESTKILHYVSLDTVGYFDFVIFTISFFITRIYLYPTRVIYSVLFESIYIVKNPQMFHFYLFSVLLITLQLMNAMWFIMIIQMIVRGIRMGRVEKDYRSDSDEDRKENHLFLDKDLQTKKKK